MTCASAAEVHTDTRETIYSSVHYMPRITRSSLVGNDFMTTLHALPLLSPVSLSKHFMRLINLRVIRQLSIKLISIRMVVVSRLLFKTHWLGEPYQGSERRERHDWEESGRNSYGASRLWGPVQLQEEPHSICNQNPESRMSVARERWKAETRMVRNGGRRRGQTHPGRPHSKIVSNSQQCEYRKKASKQDNSTVSRSWPPELDEPVARTGSAQVFVERNSGKKGYSASRS
ncbi:hypothetical protein BD410DRAFT_806911 [Rickenella mellea]|uniref:Uncharacterized protein n=1 Tax=Rickenella mellea TaxID=50990 RepID=A0A4Y7PTQ3_9AGAM|nr:hypothetical protein BD410DRAFT_806911 [Rickenella mellea]